MHSIKAGSGKPTIVCMPGYAAGAGFYYRNLRGLGKYAEIHLVDWLGTGNSGRPHFPCRTREEAESWFIDALEEWRRKKGIEEMILVGHSLGGYLSSNYALKYPDRVSHLVLVNPAGMVCHLPSPACTRPATFCCILDTLGSGQRYRRCHIKDLTHLSPGLAPPHVVPLYTRVFYRHTVRDIQPTQVARGGTGLRATRSNAGRAP